MLEFFFTLRRSKLQRPRVPGEVLARPRLWSMLDKGIDRPLTLVSAAPGFGKSTLVSSWLAQREASDDAASFLPAVWLSLDEQDGNMGIFLDYVIAALRTKLGDVCNHTLLLLHSPQQPVTKVLLTSLVNELVALPHPVLLVLDDYSAVKGEAANEFLLELIGSWPQPLHLVIISRRNPPLPLPYLRAAGTITEIRSQHLRFTWQETHDYLGQVFASPAAEDAVSAFDQQSEGWIVGIKLAAMAAQELGTEKLIATDLPGSAGIIAEYLIDEVMASQPWPVQQFLLETSILDHFSISLAQAVVSGKEQGWDAGACIAALKRADLFLVSLDSDNEWYRYHQIFRDFLRRQLRRGLSTEQIGELHRRAAEWFSQQHFVDSAVFHALEAQDLPLASSLLRVAIFEALNREDRAALDRWLAMLPEEFIQERPELLMLRAMSLQFAWQLSAQQRLLPQLERLLARDANGSEPGLDLRGLHCLLCVLRGQQAYFAMNYGAAIREFNQALALSLRTWTYVRGAAMLYLGPSMQAMGEFTAAQQLLLDAHDQYQDKSDGFSLRICLGLCFMYVAEGKLELARQTALDMLRQSQVRRLVTIECWARYFLGLVHYQRNELWEAQASLEGVLNIRHSAILVAVRESLSLLVLIHAQQGQPATAEQVLEFMRELDIDQSGRESEATLCIRARLQALTGEFFDAGRWADAFVTSAPEQPLQWVSDPYVGRVHVLLARGEPEDIERARHELVALYSVAERTHNTRFVLELLVLRAVVEELQGATSEAFATLATALDLAAADGFVRVFLDYEVEVRRLLVSMGRHMARRRKLPPALLALLPDEQQTAAGDLAPRVPPLADDLVEPLTTREREVLMLLREPLSTKEIARRLFISTSTVKRHTINIYGKLGVSRRWDAVSKAERLGQLRPR